MPLVGTNSQPGQRIFAPSPNVRATVVRVTRQGDYYVQYDDMLHEAIFLPHSGAQPILPTVPTLIQRINDLELLVAKMAEKLMVSLDSASE